MEQMWIAPAFLLLLCASCAHTKPAYKHLAGGPSEFLPPADPSAATIESHIRLLQSFVLGPESATKYEEQHFLVDSRDFTFVVLCSSEGHLENLEVTITSPSGAVVKPSETALGPFGLGGRTYPSKGLFYSGVEQGEWAVRLQPIVPPSDGSTIKAFTFVTFADGDSPVSVSVSASTLNTLTGETVQLRTEIADTTRSRSWRSANGTACGVQDDTKAVELLVRHPSGKTTTEPMHSDPSTSNDDRPVFVANLALSEVGSYQTEVVVQGQRCDGKQYERTAWYWMTAVDKSAKLSGRAVVTPSFSKYYDIVKAEQLTVNLLLDTPSLEFIPASPPYRVYAEIFTGEVESDSAVPVAWIGGLSDVAELKSSPALALHLDTSWLQGHRGPFHLRNVRVEELGTYSTISSVASMALPLEADTLLRLAAMQPVERITRHMRQGYHVGRAKRNSTSASQGTLLLVHGYCAPSTPYTLADFTNYHEFQDYNQNRLISDFAELVATFSAEHESFGAVGHSQGGIALLDMYTYLATGLDNADGERRIQALATPWRGSPLTGLLAVIGDLLGFGCGDNKDMSYDSTTKWLAGIPADTRAEVYYYTGQYSTGHLINYCNLAANAVLSWPNDGMVEEKRSNLDGGHFMGHSKGQCHSVNMRDPPIAQNHDRNVLMNLLASR